MYFIGYVYDHGLANDLFSRLESAGIPSFVRSAKVIGAESRFALFVLVESQISDARKLLTDENHVVENAIDMEQFYEFEQSFDESLLSKYVLYALGGAAAFLALVIGSVLAFG